MMPGPSNIVFISYSHQDEDWKNLFVKHLAVLGREHGFDIWDDRRMEAGTDWRPQIEQALTSASIAVLLVSVDFLASEFIRGVELPRLLLRREREGIPVVPVIVRACLWKSIDWLGSMQVFPRRGVPLAQRTPAKAEAEVARIARAIGASLRSRSSRVASPGRLTDRFEPKWARVSWPLDGLSTVKRVCDRIKRHWVILIGLLGMGTYAGYRLLHSQQPLPRVSETARLSRAAVPPRAGPSVTLDRCHFETITVDDYGSVTERRTSDARSFTEHLGDGVTLEMVLVPDGEFWMGSLPTEWGRDDDEGPRRRVTVASFFLGKYEVTQAQWRAVAALPQVQRPLESDPSKFKGAQLPVESVSWYEAHEFAARLEHTTRRRYRLPSEAEWEYAARAGTVGPFAFGNGLTSEQANFDGKSPYRVAPKGRFRHRTTEAGSFGVANSYGLFDMHGNVWEWTEDVFHDTYDGAPPDGRAWETGGDAAQRTLRGGAWRAEARRCRSASRGYARPMDKYEILGFRIALSAHELP